MTEKILITGASGFIGKALVQTLAQSSHSLRLAIHRQNPFADQQEIETVTGKDLGSDTDWSDALRDCQYVIHLAGRAHQLKDKALDPAAEFQRINTEGSLNLARQAATLGIKRFIFVSTIGVNGQESKTLPYCEKQNPNPENAYSRSKYLAEQGLLALAEQSEMEIVIIRPPLVYGAEAPGNFQRLLKLVAKEWPLPFGAIRNNRSLLARENLIDFIIHCLRHPLAANQTFVLADGEDLSTTELLKILARGMNKKTRLLPLPQNLIKWLCQLAGRQTLYQQLCGNLQIDNQKARQLLDWHPPLSTGEGLARAAEHFQKGRH